MNWYDYQARNYDPAIGRWVVQDPVVHYQFSPYSAFDNNPVFWADPSGADSENSNSNNNSSSSGKNEVSLGIAGIKLDLNHNVGAVSHVNYDGGNSSNDKSSEKNEADSPAESPDNGDPKNSDQEKPKTYNINDKDFFKVKPTVTKQTALESIKSKLFGSSLNSSKNIINKFNPKKSPLTLSPESAENINNSNIIRDAKNRLITLGAGNAVTIDIYPSVMEGSPFFNVHPVGQLKITYDGNQEGKHIFTEEEKINHSKLIYKL